MDIEALLNSCKTNDTEFKELWESAVLDTAGAESVWIEELQRQGISAAHPDDGWVNKEKNYFSLVYPQFNTGVQIGSIVALGNATKYRLIKVTRIVSTIQFAGDKYYFDEL